MRALTARGRALLVSNLATCAVMFVAATALHAAVFMGLYVALGLRVFSSPWTAIASQAAVNAVIGLVSFAAIEALPGALERRRTRRRK